MNFYNTRIYINVLISANYLISLFKFFETFLFMSFNQHKDKTLSE